jgi:L-amino acid N-acyltransferase YncA
MPSTSNLIQLVTDIHIRPGREADAAALLSIYQPYVTNTAVSFEEAVPTQAEFAARIRKALDRYAFLVATHGDELLGYAYGTQLRERAAYRWCVETSVYLAPQAQGRGLGKRLYNSLFDELIERGFCNAYAAIALPNDASVKLHEAVGFTACGVFPRAGRKFYQWHDIGWWYRQLQDK